MKKFFLALAVLFSLFFSGCVNVHSTMNLMADFDTSPAKVLNGVYKGDGIRMYMDNINAYSFQAELKAYSEDGAIFMQETIANAMGTSITQRFRITPTDQLWKYMCVDLDSLEKCQLFVSGDSLILKQKVSETFKNDYKYYDAVNIYQIFPDGKIIKRTTYNRYFFYFDAEEVISYQKQ